MVQANADPATLPRTPEHVVPPLQTAGPAPEPAGDPFDDPRRGPWLYTGDAAAATAWARHAATAAGTPVNVVPADTIGLAGDPVADTTALLRDALRMRVRLLRKVFEGRVVAVRPVGPAATGPAARLPPAQIEVTLETDEDRRAVRLEGAFAVAWHDSGARTDDIVQVDPEHPLVVVRHDRDTSEGRVLEERDLVYHIRLGDLDRAGIPPPPAEGDRQALVAAPPRRPLLGTGRHPPAGIDAMRTTDRWVTARLGGKGTRLEPALVVITDAGTLPHEALVVLREAVRSTTAPLVVLQGGEDDAARWRRIFPEAITLPAGA